MISGPGMGICSAVVLRVRFLNPLSSSPAPSGCSRYWGTNTSVLYRKRRHYEGRTRPFPVSSAARELPRKDQRSLAYCRRTMPAKYATSSGTNSHPAIACRRT